jgi:hypothetical protein
VINIVRLRKQITRTTTNNFPNKKVVVAALKNYSPAGEENKKKK